VTAEFPLNVARQTISGFRPRLPHRSRNARGGMWMIYRDRSQAHAVFICKVDCETSAARLVWRQATAWLRSWPKLATHFDGDLLIAMFCRVIPGLGLPAGIPPCFGKEISIQLHWFEFYPAGMFF
jgi:hypothetical protein